MRGGCASRAKGCSRWWECRLAAFDDDKGRCGKGMATIPSGIRAVRSPKELTPPAETAWRGFYERFGARLGFGTAFLAMLLGWLGRDARVLSSGKGLGLALGIFAMTCMLAQLLYPLRKRFRSLTFLGPVKHWFRSHMVIGTVGPLAALYHCNFSPGAFNSRVALYSALLVALSGFVGRYIYTKIHQGLYGRRTTLTELLARVAAAKPTDPRIAQFVPELSTRLATFDRTVLKPPSSLAACAVLPLKLALRTRYERFALLRFVRRRLLVESMCSPWVAKNRKGFERTTRQHVAAHLRAVRRVAEFIAYQRLFALWHVVHRPFFVILLVALAVHLYAVYRY